ncbi:hypothetical protein ACLOJK_034637 [Asimina triloba]
MVPSASPDPWPINTSMAVSYSILAQAPNHVWPRQLQQIQQSCDQPSQMHQQQAHRKPKSASGRTNQPPLQRLQSSSNIDQQQFWQTPANAEQPQEAP